MTAQLALFESADTPEQSWTVKDIWTPAWNLAINLAIITACHGKWLQLKDLREVAATFQLKETASPFSFQVAHLERNLHRLKYRYNAKSKITEWTAV